MATNIAILLRFKKTEAGVILESLASICFEKGLTGTISFETGKQNKCRQNHPDRE